jgi:PE-PPE domain
VLVHDAGDPNVTGALWVLDNNLNNPNGGFGTRYPLFSRLVGIDPTPTPTNTATVVAVKCEYDINSDAPAYALNVVAGSNAAGDRHFRRQSHERGDTRSDQWADTAGADGCCAFDDRATQYRFFDIGPGDRPANAPFQRCEDQSRHFRIGRGQERAARCCFDIGLVAVG